MIWDCFSSSLPRRIVIDRKMNPCLSKYNSLLEYLGPSYEALHRTPFQRTEVNSLNEWLQEKKMKREDAMERVFHRHSKDIVEFEVLET